VIDPLVAGNTGKKKSLLCKPHTDGFALQRRERVEELIPSSTGRQEIRKLYIPAKGGPQVMRLLELLNNQPKIGIVHWEKRGRLKPLGPREAKQNFHRGENFIPLDAKGGKNGAHAPFLPARQSDGEGRSWAVKTHTDQNHGTKNRKAAGPQEAESF